MRVAAGVLSVILGLGFGVPCVFGIRHLAQSGEVWTFLGFPTYGGGPFEQVGLEASVLLLTGFLVVCLSEVVCGVLLLTRVPYGAALNHALLPFELTYWIGFALPFGPVLGLARTLLLLAAQRRNV
jgi:hypothetical protein